MDAVEAILLRRSIRDGFSPAPVAREVLEAIVLCGLSAPSSKNAQPWRFHVVTDPQLLAEFATAVEEADGKDSYVPSDPRTGMPWENWRSTVNESAAVLRMVPVAIFVENLGHFSRSREALLNAEPDALASSILGHGLELIGVGAAIQSMWIAAIAQGLSGVFMGDILIAQKVIQARLGASGDLVGVLALGYSSENAVTRKNIPLDIDKVHWVTP